MWSKYKDTPAEAAVISRLIECDEKRPGGGLRKDEFIEILDNIIEKDVYYPNLWEVFYRWRTLKQFYWYGSTNLSEIPNDTYIAKRWKVAQVIIKHIETHSEDAWAKIHLLMLMDFLLITRGGEYGNTNLRDWAALFTDILEEGNEKE